MSEYRSQLEAYLKGIDVKADRVLDIGGSAFPIMGRTKSWDVGEYMIMDNNSEEGHHEKFTAPDIEMDIQMRTPEVREQMKGVGKFDVIFCLELSEYLRLPAIAIINIHKLMKTDGILYMSFCSLYPIHQLVDSDMLRYSKAWIEWAFSGGWDYEITPRVATKGRKHLEDFYSAEGMRAAKVPEIYDIGYMCKATKL